MNGEAAHPKASFTSFALDFKSTMAFDLMNIQMAYSRQNRPHSVGRFCSIYNLPSSKCIFKFFIF